MKTSYTSKTGKFLALLLTGLLMPVYPTIAENIGDVPRFTQPIGEIIVIDETQQNDSAAKESAIETADPVPIRPLIVTGVEVAKVTKNSITINWTTSVPTTADVSFGLKPQALNKHLLDSNLSTSHNLTVTGLKKKKLYFLKVTSITNDSRVIQSSLLSARTRKK